MVPHRRVRSSRKPLPATRRIELERRPCEEKARGPARGCPCWCWVRREEPRRVLLVRLVALVLLLRRRSGEAAQEPM